jgi:hypothetical protein
VLPKWRLREYWDPQGPFMQEIDGQPTQVGDGRTHWSPNLPRVMLPAVCSNCNSWLNKTFEEPAQPYVRAAIDNLDALDEKGTRAFALWWVKTLLLMSHPQAQRRFFRRNPKQWSTFPPDVLPRLRNTGEFPPDLSLWMALQHDESGSSRLPAGVRIMLPPTFRKDTTIQHCNYTDWAMLLPNGKFLAFQLVYHPQCDFVHPFEAAGLATRLWPKPPSLHLAQHPVLDADGWRQWRNLFRIDPCPRLEYDTEGNVIIQFGQRLQCSATPVP